MLFSRKGASWSRVTSATPVPLRHRGDEIPAYLKPLVLTVEEDWEAPDPAQFQNALQAYVEDLLEPLDGMERALDEKRVLFRCKVERMMELAPEFFEKALARSAFEAGIFIENGGENAG